MSGQALNDLPLPIGSMLYKYQIQSVIGRGGYAWVYKGHDTFIGRDVAIKILHRDGGVTDDMLRRGQAEAKLLSRLRHPSIVEIYDAGVSEQRLLYIIMELLIGSSLFASLRTHRRLTLAEGLPLFIEVAEAIETAHKQGAIHRDIKPENIFIVEGNHAKVLDFGIAKITDAGEAMTTKRDMMIGTLLYMSPEQAQGQSLTVRSDIYALGLVMYEAFAGIHPMLIDCPDVSMRALACKQLMEIPPSLEALTKDTPRDLSRVVDRCVSKRASERYASMAELAKALRNCWAKVQRELGKNPSQRDLAGLSSPRTDSPGFAQVASDRRVLVSRSAAALSAGALAEPTNEPIASTPSPRPAASTLVGPGPVVSMGSPAAESESSPEATRQATSHQDLPSSEASQPAVAQVLQADRSTTAASTSDSNQQSTPAVEPVTRALRTPAPIERSTGARIPAEVRWWGSLFSGALLGVLVFGTSMHLYLKRAASNAQHLGARVISAASPVPSTRNEPTTVAAAVGPGLPSASSAPTSIARSLPPQRSLVSETRQSDFSAQSTQPATSAAKAAELAPRPSAVKATAKPPIRRQPDGLDALLKEYEREAKERLKKKGSTGQH